MHQNRSLPVLYAVNLSLLTAHEIDSAFWREWELFRLPGGSQLFVLLHVPLLLVSLYGFRQLLSGRRSGHWIALVLACAGIGGSVVHGLFLIHGDRRFSVPASVAVLLAVCIVSLMQAFTSSRLLLWADNERPAARCSRPSQGPQ
jgi:hypothetical protein